MEATASAASASAEAARPFAIDIPDDDIKELRARLETTRWPPMKPIADASQGVQLDTTRALTEEIIYVLEGELEYQIEGEPPRKVKAGEALTVPAEAVHAVKNVRDRDGAELATYVVEKGKPLVILAE